MNRVPKISLIEAITGANKEGIYIYLLHKLFSDGVHFRLQALLGFQGIQWFVQAQEVMKGCVVCTLI